MADKFYAWSNINPPDGKAVSPGDEVTQTALKVDDDTWNTWVEEGVIRTMPYPPTNVDESPINFYYRQARSMATLQQGVSDAQAIDPDAAKTALSEANAQAKAEGKQ